MNEEKTQLKPCPFCGVSLTFKQPRHGDDYYEHPKNECLLDGSFYIADPITVFDSPDAIREWNRRASPSVNEEKTEAAGGVTPCPGDGCNGCAGCWKVSETQPENTAGVALPHGGRDD